MDLNKLNTILTIGENIAVEFKRCGNGIESDTYETVCSFLNRFGGDIFLGVLDDGTVVGVPEKAAPDMVKNFIKVISNPALFSPTVYLVPEIIQYVFFVKHFSLKKASEFPVFSEGFSLL